MFSSRPAKRRQPVDAAAPRLGRPRRLAIEAMENRLMLSNNQIDYSIWNLDSVKDNYAVISNGGTLPVDGATLANDSDSISPGGQIDVSWVQVPGLYLTRTQATSLAYLHYRDAVAQGFLASDVSAQLYNQWKVGFAFDSPDGRVPVFAIGFGSQRSGLEGGLGEYALDTAGNDVLAPIDLPFLQLGSAVSPSATSLSSSYSVTRSWYLDSGNSLSADFGVVKSTDGASLFGDRLSDSISVGSIFGAGGMFDGPLVHRFEFSTNFQSTLDVALDDALETPIVEVPLVKDALEIVSPGANQPSAVDTELLSSTNTTSSSAPRSDSVSILDVTSPSVPTSVIDLGSQIIVDVITKASSLASSDLNAVVDELLAEDSILAENSGETVSENTAVGNEATVAANDGEVAAAPEAEQLAEGGMVPVESIVGAMANGSMEFAPVGEQLASAGEGSELVGDLARVAVMELIEGAEEPMAPGSTINGDHVAVLAAHDAAGSMQFAKVARSEIVAVQSVVRTLAEQASSVVALVMPVSPSYLAALMTTVSDAFAAVAFGETQTADADSAGDAREEAFADWDGTDAPTKNEDDGFSYASTLPLVGALAVERLMAAKRRRQEAIDERNPKRRNEPLS